MEYLYVLAAFIFVTVIALILKSKREKEARSIKEKERNLVMENLVMEEQIRANAEIEARKQAAQKAEQKTP